MRYLSVKRKGYGGFSVHKSVHVNSTQRDGIGSASEGESIGPTGFS